jgi:DeoR family transcriptional regulator, glycerol-3-phosphate regulon repressor
MKGRVGAPYRSQCDVREVEISRAIIEHARKIVLVADSSKFSRSAPVRIADLSEIDIFITDNLPTSAIADMCRRCEVEVIETGGPNEFDANEPQKARMGT